MQAFLCKFLMLIFLANRLFANSLEIEVSARSAILINAETGKILFEKNARIASYPASVTKIATALFALERKNLDLEGYFTPSLDCLTQMRDPAKLNPPYHLAPDGTMLGMRRGETFPVRALFYGMMLVSGNDAANAVAELSSGSVMGFVEEMNHYLKSIGCLETHFCNPHGYHHPDHVTTAYDLSILAQRALRHPELKKILGAKSFLVPKTNKQPAREIVTFNRLMKNGKYHYPYAVGGKTGYHSKAQSALVAAAQKNSRSLIGVVLGCKTKEGRYEDVIKLFEAAFNEPKERKLLVRADQRYLREIPGASSQLRAFLSEDVYCTFYPSEEPHCRAFVYWDDVKAPIEKGSRVGELRIFGDEAQILCSAPFFAEQKVKKTFFASLKDFFLSRFR